MNLGCFGLLIYTPSERLFYHGGNFMSNVVTLYDFNDVDPRTKKTEYQVEAEGWYPVDIEYSFNDNDRYISLCWKIVDTDHVFKIDKQVIDAMHHGNIREHFQQTLVKFREHYLRWEELGYSASWKDHYHSIFGQYIRQ